MSSEEEQKSTKSLQEGEDRLHLITQKIKYGGYSTSKRIGKNYGRYCRVINDIYDEKGMKINYHFWCTVCENAIHVDTRIGTTQLNRHADRCAPITNSPSTSSSGKSKRSSDLHNEPVSKRSKNSNQQPDETITWKTSMY